MERVKFFGGWSSQSLPTNRDNLETEINTWLAEPKSEVIPGGLYTKTINNIFANNTVNPSIQDPKIIMTVIVYFEYVLTDYLVSYTATGDIDNISEVTVTFADGEFTVPVGITTFTFDETVDVTTTNYTATLTDGVWDIIETV